MSTFRLIGILFVDNYKNTADYPYIAHIEIRKKIGNILNCALYPRPLKQSIGEVIKHQAVSC